MNRRDVMKKLAIGSVLFSTPQVFFSQKINENKKMNSMGNINHSVCRWIFNELPIEDLCVLVKKIGFSAIDLVEPSDFPVLKKYGSTRSPAQTALASGICCRANAQALMMKSLTESLTPRSPSFALSCARKASRSSSSMSRRR